MSGWKVNMVKLPIIPKLIKIFEAISTKIQMAFLNSCQASLDKLNAQE